MSFKNITCYLLGCHLFVDAENNGSNPHAKIKNQWNEILFNKLLTLMVNKLTLTLFQQQILNY